MSDYLEKVNDGASVTLIKRALFKARGKKGGPGGEATLGKFMCFKPDGTIEKIKDSDKPTFFEFESVPVNSLDDLYSVLTRAVKREGVRAMVQAAPKPEFYGVGPVVRRVLGEGAPFAEIARPYLFLDIDHDTAIDGVDMSDAATVGAFVRSRLPPRFQKARCISYLSAGHGRNGCVRCRLIFWLDRPLTQSQQKALASTCEVVVDKSIYTAVSLIYLHFNTTVYSRPDPFKGKRWRCLPGEDRVVTPPNDELKNRTAEKTRPKREAQAKKVSEKTGRRIVYGSFEEILLTLGDPRDDEDVKLGFFEPITEAIKAFAREAYANSEAPNADDCEAKIAAAISAAYAAPSRENGGRAKASYLADLRRHVDGIFAGYAELRAQAMARKLARAVPLDEATRIIHAKANEITAEVVRAKLKLPKRDVTAVFGAVDIDDDTTAIVEVDTLADQEEVDTVSPIEGKPSHRARLGGAHLVKVTVGAGKTHAFIQAAADAAILGVRIAWIAPTHKLARETQTRFAEKGIDAQIWYGVEQPKPGDTKPMCAFPALMSVSFAVGGTTKDVCKGCSEVETCFYPSQNVRAADIVIFAGAAYLHGVPEGARIEGRFLQFDMVVIDEAPIGGFVETDTIDFAREDFARKAPPNITLQDDDLATEGLRRMEAFASLFDGNQKAFSYAAIRTALARHSRGYWLKTEDLLYGALVKPARIVSSERAAHEDDPAQVLFPKELKAATEWNKHVVSLMRLCRVAALLPAEEKAADDAFAGQARLRLSNDRAYLSALGRKRVNPDWRGTTKVILDATADPELVRLCFGELASVTDVRVENGAAVRIKQVAGPYSYGWFGLTEVAEAEIDANSQERVKYTKRFEKVRRFITQLSGRFRGGETGVIAPKEIIAPTNAHTGQRIAGAGLCDGLDRVSAAWFNALRGLDAMKAVRNLVVVSRPLPRTEVVERMAESLLGEIVIHADNWRRSPTFRRIHRKDGGEGLSAVSQMVHPNPTAERIRRQITDAELAQAIGRARGVRRNGWADSLTIWVLNDALLSEHVVELVDQGHFERAVVHGVRGLLAEGVAAGRKGRRELLSEMLGVSATHLRDTLPEAAPEGMEAGEWLDWEKSTYDVLGGEHFIATTDKGTTAAVVIIGGEDIGRAYAALKRAGVKCSVTLKNAL